VSDRGPPIGIFPKKLKGSFQKNGGMNANSVMGAPLQTLLSACGSRWLLELAGLLFDQAERHRILRPNFGPQKRLKRDTVREHRQIFEATLARDAKAAMQALQRHYRVTAEQVVAVLTRAPCVAAARD
jgi:FCD domain